MNYTYTKTKLMAHQVVALERAAGKKGFALLMEQGTGKTVVFLEEGMRLHATGEIDCILVLAPNGVHENWILDQVPAHIPDDFPCVAAYYATDATIKERKAIDRVMTPRKVGEVLPLRILSVSYDSLLVDKAFKDAESFVSSGKCMIVADESHKIKNMDARRTRRAINLRKQCPYRRIGTGTVTAGNPLDAFSQFSFLEEGLLGTESLVVFRKEYCELLPQTHGVVRHIIERRERALGRKMSSQEIERFMPAIVATDPQGRPIYKNLDKLQALIAPHSYRVLKTDCLDLPEKQYETRYFRLTPAQRRVYGMMEKEQRHILEDGTVLTATKLVAMSKLRQITSGFVLMRDGTVSYLEDNPRVQLLHEELESIAEQGVIWSQYKEEQRSIARVCKELGVTCETVNGDVPMKRRREIRDEFKAGNLQWISAHPATMAEGYTLVQGKVVYYYSNGFNMIERVQSEDRTHRIGQNDTVTYRDFVAIDTRDDNVVWALQHRLDTAAMISGDPARKSRFQERESGT